MRGAEDTRRGVEKTLCDLRVSVVNNLGTIERSLFSHTWLRRSPRWILRGEHSLSGDPPGCFRLLAGKSPPMKAKFRYQPPRIPPQACASPLSRATLRESPYFNGDAFRYLISSKKTINITDGNVGVLSQLVNQIPLHQKRPSTGLV